MSGRPRKAGLRQPSGDLAPPRRNSEQARAEVLRKSIAARSVVLNQPHRKGDPGIQAESVVGRFCTFAGMRKEVYEAALAYQALVGKWRGTWGAPRDAGTPGDSPGGTGEGPTLKSADRWMEQIRKVEAALAKVNAGSEIQQLVIAEIQVQKHQYRAAYLGLAALAVAMGTLTGQDEPRA